MRNVSVFFIHQVQFMSTFMGDIDILDGMVVFTKNDYVFSVPLSNVSYIEADI